MNGTLDPTDIKILNLLQQDARLNLQKISERVHKSTSSVNERISKLKEQGFIKRYVAILDPEKIGKHFLAITQVTLSVHTRAALTGFEEKIKEWPEVLLCLHLSGACDFILHIAVPDSSSYHDFLLDRLCIMEQVANVQTFIVLKECKSNSPYPL